ncbi:MAG: prepilin-type N-terminal cleavage/methylation domain-containing protein [Deltaproteobacteria bacterium]|nr:prepilin-type N-terminal cleavage/methylation domain-containing protein [Deltaproteobacteria bacterium]
MRHPRKEKHGFTLIELMIIVAILGVLASIAIPAYVGYLKRSKTSEVSLNLKNIFMGAVTYFDGEHSGTTLGATYTHYLPSTITSTPSTPASGTKFSVTAHAADFSTNPGWLALGFGPNENFYYQYDWFSGCGDTPCDEGDLAFAGAQGNLDNDTDFSDFQRMATVASGQLTCGPIKMTAELE